MSAEDSFYNEDRDLDFVDDLMSELLNDDFDGHIEIGVEDNIPIEGM